MGIKYRQGYVVKCDQKFCQESLELEEPMAHPPITMMNKKGWEYDVEEKKCYCPTCSAGRKDAEKIKRWYLKRGYETTVIYDPIYNRFALSIKMSNGEYDHFFVDGFYDALDKLNRLSKLTREDF